jgi:tetratricopeptide (TPR) repeat protein
MPILNNLGVIAELRGDHEDAEQKYSDALAMALETADRDAELVYMSNLGGTLVALNRPVEAEERLRTVIEMSPESSLLSETYQFLSESLAAQGRFEEAREAGVMSLDLAITSESPDDIAGAWRVLGNLASSLGEPLEIPVGPVGIYDAAALFANSLEVSESVESDADKAKVLASWAIHELRRGNVDESARVWEQAREILVGLGADREIERVERILAAARHSVS